MIVHHKAYTEFLKILYIAVAFTILHCKYWQCGKLSQVYQEQKNSSPNLHKPEAKIMLNLAKC